MSNDLDLIAQLEKEIGVKLKKLELGEIEKETTNGFAVNENGDVIGLNLDDLKSESLPKIFPKFQHLKCFSLVGTEIKDYSILQSLSNLIYLNLRDNSLTDISFLQGLINLRELYLGSNELTDISFLQGLKNLTILDLIGNKIKELPEEIFDLGIEIDVKSDWTPGEGFNLACPRTLAQWNVS
jgi:Leucine-rich repeat (LRR) protein